MTMTTIMEGQAQRAVVGGKAFGRSLSSSASSSSVPPSSFLDLFHQGGHHSSGSCSRCGSACRCASCCRCRSSSSSSVARRGMMTTASAATTTSSLSPTSNPHRHRHHRHRRRSVSSSSAASSSPPVVDVTVASMGESITEGTVAAVLKAPGESVAADEVIAQIETDKVTIDVRAPFSGKISSLEVKEGETVVVGQVVAKVEEGATTAGEVSSPAAAAAKPEAAAAAEKKKKEEPAASAAAAAPPPARPSAVPSPPPPRKQTQQQRRKPSISFPARLTRAGVRISSLPAGEAREARAALAAAELDGPELAERLSRGRPAGSNATIPLYVGTERGTKLSASRVLSDREMEMIELGGAAP